MKFESIFRFLIPLFILIVWIFQMLKRLPKDTRRQPAESERVEGGEDFNMDANPYKPQTQPAPQGLSLDESKTSMKGQPLTPTPKPEGRQADSIHTGTGLRDHTGKRPQRVKQIAGIPLNAKSFYQGIILSEILMPPKSKRGRG